MSTGTGSLFHAPGRGSAYFYDRGCRCHRCRDEKRLKRRRSRDRARASNSPAYQRELAASRALKCSYRGTCERCGGATRYHGHGLRVASLCAKCSREDLAALAVAKRGHGPTVERVLAYVGGSERRFSEVRDQFGMSNGHAANVLHRLVKFGFLVRPRRGLYRRAS